MTERSCVTCHYYEVLPIRSGDRILTDGFCNRFPSQFACIVMRKKDCGVEGRFHDERAS